MRRHLVLVGLPGAGKSSVGRLAAGLLRCPFVDLDEMLAQASGESVGTIFATRGESVFRELEREAMAELLDREPMVIAPGGGWAAQPGNLEAAEPVAVVVYLSVSPGTAATRLAGTGDRPLLAGDDPREVLEQMLRSREPFYRRAALEVDGEAGSVEVVAEAVVAAARRYGL